LTVGIFPSSFFVNLEDLAQHVVELVAALNFREKVFFSFEHAPHGLIGLFPLQLLPEHPIVFQFNPRSESENGEHA
jgi:hypothetical protein